MGHMRTKPTVAQAREAAALLGRLGGIKRSERKRLACVANAKRPRPNRRKQPVSQEA